MNNNRSPFTAVFFAALMALGMAGCAGAGPAVQKSMEKTGNAHINYLLLKITEINANAPKSCIATFTIEGKLQDNKNFKSTGRSSFADAGTAFSISFIDFIFKSPLTSMVLDGSRIKIHFPVDKKLYSDHIDLIRLKNYTGLDFDFKFLYQMMCWRIPLIDGYTVKEGLEQDGANAKGGKNTFIILENSRFYETIQFKGDVPTKILLINKQNKQRMEFYLNSPVRKNKSLVFQNIKFVSESTGERVIIAFNSIQCDVPVNRSSITSLRLARGTQIITVH